MKAGNIVVIFFLGAVAAVGGIMLYGELDRKKTDTQTDSSSGPGKKSAGVKGQINIADIKAGKRPIRPDFTLADMQGKKHHIKKWDGKVIILNFWATWCPPCKREMPAFIKLQKKYGEAGLQIIGVAIDQKQLVQDFIDSIGVNYVMLIGQIDAVNVAKLYGNFRGQLPYTVIINRQRQIVMIKRGELKIEPAEKIIKYLLSINKNARR